MIFSRKVFWGATKPRRPPGIFTTYFDHEAPFSAISSKILLSLHFHHIVLLHILRTSSPSNGLGKWSWPETAEVCTVRTFSPSSHWDNVQSLSLSDSLRIYHHVSKIKLPSTWEGHWSEKRFLFLGFKIRKLRTKLKATNTQGGFLNIPSSGLNREGSVRCRWGPGEDLGGGPCCWMGQGGIQGGFRSRYSRLSLTPPSLFIPTNNSEMWIIAVKKNILHIHQGEFQLGTTTDTKYVAITTTRCLRSCIKESKVRQGVTKKSHFVVVFY